MSFFGRLEGFFDDLADRFRRDNEENRREERDLDTANELAAAENDVVDGATPLKVVAVDFLASQNAVNHNCEKFQLVSVKEGTPIIRRGGSFSFTVQLNKDIDFKKKQLLKCYFSFGHQPNAQKGTQAVLTVSGKTMFDKNHEQWDIRVVEQEGTKATIEVQVPTDACVGIWKPTLELKSREDPDSSRRHLLRLETLIYILFNPWNKNDDVYLPDEEKRQEYVLNDVGKIWMGSYPTGRGRQWVFGQFDDVVLPACILLLERSGIPPESRGDPIRVCRAISKMVNSNDDSGVVLGRWSGKYEDGTPPSAWTGSIDILEKYVRTNRPVRYGQCWVFAGVTNTVCRAVGIPARVVTNFNSAHDTNISLTIDQYLDKDGNEIEGYNFDGPNPTGLRDSIWNFHVWNDVWMTRPDIPHEGYGGWQAIDSTPQETSEGSYQCGPASLEAIRRGQAEYKYDIPFVLAEVNADVVQWQEDEEAQDGFRKLFSNKYHVGRQLLTKKPGPLDDDGFAELDREDVTIEYKPAEGTRAERVTLHTAARRSRAARHAFRMPSEAIDDVDFEIEDVERVPIGEDFSVTVKATNTTDSKRTISIYLSTYSMYYTGAKANDIKKAEGKFTLQAQESKTQKMVVRYNEYYEKLVEHAMVRAVAICKVEETTYAWVGDDKLDILKPAIKIELKSEGVVGKPLLATFSFTNPLHVTLRDCSLVVDGPGLTRPKTIPISNVAPNAEMSYELRIIPKKAADCSLVATFHSTQLLNLTGSTKVTISPADE